jgi:hypothetical protein
VNYVRYTDALPHFDQHAIHYVSNSYQQTLSHPRTVAGSGDVMVSKSRGSCDEE